MSPARNIRLLKHRFIGSALSFDDDANTGRTARNMKGDIFSGQIAQFIRVPENERFLRLLLVRNGQLTRCYYRVRDQHQSVHSCFLHQLL
jgi:hypothetical protein